VDQAHSRRIRPLPPFRRASNTPRPRGNNRSQYPR
jgi:hypothetical protein